MSKSEELEINGNEKEENKVIRFSAFEFQLPKDEAFYLLSEDEQVLFIRKNLDESSEKFIEGLEKKDPRKGCSVLRSKLMYAKANFNLTKWLESFSLMLNILHVLLMIVFVGTLYTLQKMFGKPPSWGNMIFYFLAFIYVAFAITEKISNSFKFLFFKYHYKNKYQDERFARNKAIMVLVGIYSGAIALLLLVHFIIIKWL